MGIEEVRPDVESWLREELPGLLLGPEEEALIDLLLYDPRRESPRAVEDSPSLETQPLEDAEAELLRSVENAGLTNEIRLLLNSVLKGHLGRGEESLLDFGDRCAHIGFASGALAAYEILWTLAPNVARERILLLAENLFETLRTAYFSMQPARRIEFCVVCSKAFGDGERMDRVEDFRRFIVSLLARGTNPE